MKQALKMKRVGFWVIAVFITLGSTTLQQAYAQESPEVCKLSTLRGVYIFDGSGYNITTSGPQPKAVVEFLAFKGDGTLDSLATRSVNGVVTRGVVGTGNYTVNDDCTGTLSFNPHGPHFDIFIAVNGKEYHMIQIDSNTVLAGVSRRVPY